MQFSVALITSVLLVVAAAPGVLGADFVWFAGANCTGSVVARSPDATPYECHLFANANGTSVESISYSDVPNHAYFYKLGPARPACSNGVMIVTDSGSGCATAPTGLNIAGFMFS